MIEKMKSNLLAGIATIVPLALTVYVIQVTLEITIWLGGTVAEPLERFVDVTFPGFGLISSLVGLLIVLIALIIFGGFISWGIYFWLYQYLNVTQVTYVAIFPPIVAIFLGWVFLGEVLTTKEIVGTLFILGSSILIYRK